MVTIIVDGGETFEGNLEQWSDCFFDVSDYTEANACSLIVDYCKEQGWEVEIREAINIRCPECRAEFGYINFFNQGRCPECGYLIYEDKNDDNC